MLATMQHLLRDPTIDRWKVNVQPIGLRVAHFSQSDREFSNSGSLGAYSE